MKPAIPKTDSIEELAQFWDTHDVTDYTEELKEVPSPFERPSNVRVPLSAGEREAVRKLASQKGLDEGALVHEWVKEKLHHR